MATASGDDANAVDNPMEFFSYDGLSYKPLNPDAVPLGDWVDMDIKDGFLEDYRLEQYAQSVVDFSSQYGSDYSISYTAPNVTGRPLKYPEYGDFPETFAMRTYGDWWNRAPSAVKEIQCQNRPELPAQDFIVLTFENYILPTEIAIFETFNPGSVIRIWAYTIMRRWVCLWEASDFFVRPPLPIQRVRIFSPPIKQIKMPTKTIRLEFNHTHLGYFTEIDAVLLSGKNCNIRNTQRLLAMYEQQRKGTIVHKLQSIQFRPNFKDNQIRLQEFLMNDLSKFVGALAQSQSESAESSEESESEVEKKVGLKNMPFDIVLNIFSYLDLKSLFRVGQVCRFFYDVSKHPLLYSEINLKPYWNLASNELLTTLAKRATVLKKLDLSWCGLFNSISSTEFKKLISQRGDNLTNLRLNSCKFLSSTCIWTIGFVCDNLRELSLRNISTDAPLINAASLVNLKHLERLDLFQTVIETDLLLIILKNNRNLKHVNLAFCGVNVNMDEVAQHLGAYNRRLVSLDMWKSHFLSTTGLRALSHCHDLEEVDFGWCLREATLDDSLRQLLTNCPKLRKLFLATVRGLTDRDVQDIANVCPNLEQLDLMGVLGINKERYYEILVKCKKLQLLDLSFCDNIDENDIALWARNFKVHIKCNSVPVEHGL